jgi:predicted GIY-YIG superfamily endonuclease
MIIYKIINIVNNKIYIGKTERTLTARLKSHNDAAKKRYKRMNEFHVKAIL